jgi:hypothetical protein
MCGTRDALVGARTKLVNTVRGWLRADGRRLRSGEVSTFSTRVRALSSPGPLPSYIERQLRVIDELNGVISEADQRVGKELRFVEPKSEQSRRTISIPNFASAILKRHRTAQLEERLKAGSRWTDSGLVFTSTIGTPLDERNVRRAFVAVLKGAKLPSIRIHDLRHTCASLLLVQGLHPRVVMETLGHSQISLTLDTYSHVQPCSRKLPARSTPSSPPKVRL